jgi:serine/threonine-protein kinase
MTSRRADHVAGQLPAYVGRYRVVERIGRGAMGVVYAAIDEQLNRRVAVKVMLGDFDEDPELRQRFAREARITGQLAHRNIVTVFDLGEDGGRPFIVMELLEGLPLAEYLKSGSHSIDHKIDLMMQICDGLQNAHGCGVIHRDLKPNNLFVQTSGSLKILDFGVARLASSNLTASGFLLGTPEYMSPEQAQGRSVDARSDVFSAGSVFYYMLAGHSPFFSRDLPKMLESILHDKPAPLSPADAPDALRRVVEKALAKSPVDRYQQCSAMLDDLARARRSYSAAAYLVTNAAVDRYRRILGSIQERRALGRALRIASVEASCDDALSRLAARFPAFAKYADATALIDPMDRSVAQAALEALQERHNAELAALAAMREGGADRLRGTPAKAAPSQATQDSTADSDRGSWVSRAASIWRGGRQ